jgi:putative membrane protein
MKHSKLVILFFVAVLSIWTFEACNNNPNSSTNDSVDSAKQVNENKENADTMAAGMSTMPVDEQDSKFAVNAANAGMTEVEAGNLGKQKATSTAVKEYAAMFVTDHTKANEELKTLAGSKNITLPSMVGDDMQKKLTDLAQKSAKDFDKDFINMAIDAHKDAIDMFEKESNDGKDADIKAFAYKMLPALRAHLDAAKAIKDKMK